MPSKRNFLRSYHLALGFILLVSHSTVSLADANQGEFMGYKIGDSVKEVNVPLKGGFYGRGYGGNLSASWWIKVGSNSKSPDAVNVIGLFVTPISRTIKTICADAFFDSEAQGYETYINYRRYLPSKRRLNSSLDALR